ncbi:DNA invertase Pin-like site-specific DNA recombinase [Nitrobacter vulgaris]|uniref:recombinase family protein n=1 Tax=Nitrobacter vulgaris TaxID=29421 RepID=UPI0028591A06|nr:recombinase family protein [Nitrobacter vulgaris]MDR6303298.1 DNA invertase Pin-like site-specific DNA recombinase [Nitrobacter vulgaris]
MPSERQSVLRCAVYTRKSTEHGLEQEFNSLDAQREACESYIKSQASQGWRALPARYDDPAYSGGNLDRPALKRLLADIEVGKVDVIVVYKIDRLTRSLADFAKLVETFDARSISFVAVTQQFNTTTSMGRLTLNVLLSFAQFERELASERVKDKIAASRKKGKWTGGTVPLGYEIKDRKLAINKTEAQTVRTIFKLYLQTGSLSKLIAELDKRKIVTKRRNTEVKKYQGGIPFTYGPLAYLLKNRIYLGEIHHGGKWFKGEHQPILDRTTFNRVQDQLKSNTVNRPKGQSANDAPLTGKLFDDRGNRMGPSFSRKNGVRYRFYTSTALRGRKHLAGSVKRVPATEIEQLIEHTIREQLNLVHAASSDIFDGVDRAVINRNHIWIAMKPAYAGRPIEIPWRLGKANAVTVIETTDQSQSDPKLLQAIVRAYAWLNDLKSGHYDSIEALAREVRLHPKIIRQQLRLAFLAPTITEAAIAGGASTLTLGAIPKMLPLSWFEQRKAR